MEDQMLLCITLRKEVEDREEGRALFDMVVERLADYPNVIVSGLVSNHFNLNKN